MKDQMRIRGSIAKLTSRVSLAVRGLDWTFTLTQGPVITLFAVYFIWKAAYFVREPEFLFTDARLYFRATEAWLAGGNPWAGTIQGWNFAGPPPTLLLDVPLIPFGEDAAWAFWPIAGAYGIWRVVRRLGLPIWWMLFPPVIEGWLAGSPDMALAGLAMGPIAWIAALGKPYAVPAMLGDGKWRSVALAGGVAVMSAPFLPWGLFFGNASGISSTLDVYTSHLSAWGNPVGMVAATIALLALDGRLRGGLLVPALWPNSQLHYSVFSMFAASRSPILSIGLALPVPGAAPAAVMIYAIWAKFRGKAQPFQGRARHAEKAMPLPVATPDQVTSEVVRPVDPDLHDQRAEGDGRLPGPTDGSTVDGRKAAQRDHKGGRVQEVPVAVLQPAAPVIQEGGDEDRDRRSAEQPGRSAAPVGAQRQEQPGTGQEDGHPETVRPEERRVRDDAR